MPYEVLSHTADTGIEARADTLADLVADLATGMFNIIADPDCRTAKGGIELVVGAPTPEDLVMEALSDLLYESEVEDLWLCDFHVETEGDLRMRLRARGVPFPEVELVGPPIKAVTYHDLAVVEDSDGWYGRVYFDV